MEEPEKINFRLGILINSSTQIRVLGVVIIGLLETKHYYTIV